VASGKLDRGTEHVLFESFTLDKKYKLCIMYIMIKNITSVIAGTAYNGAFA